MVDILIMADNSCQLQDGLAQNIKALILSDNVGSHFESVDSWDENLIYPMWDGTKVVENDVMVLDKAKYDKKVEILASYKVEVFGEWGIEGDDDAELNKRKIDVNARMTELEAMTSPTVDEATELSDYYDYFAYGKVVNEDLYIFNDQINAMTTVAEVEAYTWAFSPHTTLDPNSDSGFFVLHGFSQA